MVYLLLPHGLHLRLLQRLLGTSAVIVSVVLKFKADAGSTEMLHNEGGMRPVG